jgi:hypothetical protein
MVPTVALNKSVFFEDVGSDVADVCDVYVFLAGRFDCVNVIFRFTSETKHCYR